MREDLGDRTGYATARDVSRAVGSEASAARVPLSRPGTHSLNNPAYTDLLYPSSAAARASSGSIDSATTSQSGSWRLPRRCRPRLRPLMIANL